MKKKIKALKLPKKRWISSFSEPERVTEESIGKLVSYYDEGWHVGTLEKIKKNVATIKPLVLYGKKHSLKIPLADVKLIEERYLSHETLNQGLLDRKAAVQV